MTYDEYYNTFYTKHHHTHIENSTGIRRSEEEIEGCWKYYLQNDD